MKKEIEHIQEVIDRSLRLVEFSHTHPDEEEAIREADSMNALDQIRVEKIDERRS